MYVPFLFSYKTWRRGGRAFSFPKEKKINLCVLQNTSRLIGLFWKGKKSEIGVDITGPDVIKLFSCSAEHEILNVHRCKNIKNFSFFQAQISLECYFSYSEM